jgi:hypothetical protein
MKTMLLFCITLLHFTVFAQSPAIDDFFANRGYSENTFKISIGGALIKLGSWFIEEPATRSLVRKARRARVLFSDDQASIPLDEIDRLVRGIRFDGYESLAMFRDHLDRIEVFVREDKDLIRNLLVIVRSDDEFVMASLDCRLTYDQLNAALKREL